MSRIIQPAVFLAILGFFFEQSSPLPQNRERGRLPRRGAAGDKAWCSAGMSRRPWQSFTRAPILAPHHRIMEHAFLQPRLWVFGMPMIHPAVLITSRDNASLRIAAVSPSLPMTPGTVGQARREYSTPGKSRSSWFDEKRASRRRACLAHRNGSSLTRKLGQLRNVQLLQSGDSSDSKCF